MIAIATALKFLLGEMAKSALQPSSAQTALSLIEEIEKAGPALKLLGSAVGTVNGFVGTALSEFEHVPEPSGTGVPSGSGAQSGTGTGVPAGTITTSGHLPIVATHVEGAAQ